MKTPNKDIEFKEGMILLEPKEKYYKAIIGIKENRVVYSLHDLIQIYIDKDGMDFMGALEWIDYNIIDVPIKGWPIIKHDI